MPQTVKTRFRSSASAGNALSRLEAPQSRRLDLVFEDRKRGKAGSDLSQERAGTAPLPEQEVGPPQGGKALPERSRTIGVMEDDIEVPGELQVLESVVEDGQVEPRGLGLDARKIAVLADEDPGPRDAPGDHRRLIPGFPPAGQDGAAVGEDPPVLLPSALVAPGDHGRPPSELESQAQDLDDHGGFFRSPDGQASDAHDRDGRNAPPAAAFFETRALRPADQAGRTGEYTRRSASIRARIIPCPPPLY